MSNISPEERLLRLIKGQSRQKEGEQAKKQGVVEPAVKSEPVIEKPLKINGKRLIGKNKTTIFMARLNAALILAIVMLVAYFFFEQVLFTKKMEMLRSDQIKTAPKAKSEADIYTSPDLSYYSQAISKRELFTTEGRKRELISQGPQKDVTEAVKNLSLIGVVWEEPPQAIIEDKSANKTYFLYKGDRIGEFEVKEISNNKVLLSYQGQDIELMI